MKIIFSCCVLAAVLAFSAEARGPAPDTDWHVDLARISASIESAYGPLTKRLAASKLDGRMEAVETALSAFEADPDSAGARKLAAALGEVESEISALVSDWNSMTAPIFQGREEIGLNIERIRKTLARSKGAPEGEAKHLRDADEARLTQIADAIRATECPERRQRLRDFFAHAYRVKQIRARLTSGTPLSTANFHVLEGILDSLGRLDKDLEDMAFRLETGRIVLMQYGELFGQCRQMLEGLATAAEFQKDIAQFVWRGPDSFSFPGVDAPELEKTNERLVGALWKFVERTFASDAPAAPRAGYDVDDADLDAVIRAYQSKTHQEAER